MRFTGTDRDDDSAPWFRIGQLDVNTTVFILLAWVVTLLVFVIEPVNKPIMQSIAMIPSDVTAGQVWRVFTWPWSHAQFGLFDIIGAALLFLFGTDLERQLGRRSYAILIGASIVIIGVAGTVLSSLLPGETVIADLDLLYLTVILLYIAEHPTRPFFFGIPAWVIGAVIVALEVVNDLAFRDWIRLLTVLVAAALIALVARKVQLLTAYDRVPELAMRRRRRKKDDSGAAAPKPSAGPGPSTGPGRRKDAPSPGAEPKRPGRLWGKKEEPEPAEIVQMPTQPRRSVPVSSGPEFSADDLALDLLLDKISEGGLEALTPQERQELDDLRARRRGPTGGQPPKG